MGEEGGEGGIAKRAGKKNSSLDLNSGHISIPSHCLQRLLYTLLLILAPQEISWSVSHVAPELSHHLHSGLVEVADMKNLDALGLECTKQHGYIAAVLVTVWVVVAHSIVEPRPMARSICNRKEQGAT